MGRCREKEKRRLSSNKKGRETAPAGLKAKGGEEGKLEVKRGKEEAVPSSIAHL